MQNHPYESKLKTRKSIQEERKSDQKIKRITENNTEGFIHNTINSELVNPFLLPLVNLSINQLNEHS
jgi:hypothetical protein